MEENSDKFVIQLLIGKQVYPITVRRDQEEVYRKASRMINEISALRAVVSELGSRALLGSCLA